ncbi:hypothetical protein V2K57_11715 [Pseudomonas alliivorans]|nr:hypothetical protein [Pseudomonas alliivorans]MEE4701423.1 hypothetical protein [Pseudomonas alliivorans]MEE4737043.1 hypothetical protein [Pseudomonas alliivorans]
MSAVIYVYKSGNSGLGWAELDGSSVKVSGGGFYFSLNEEISLHTVDDPDGAAKLQDEALLLSFLAQNVPSDRGLVKADFLRVKLGRGSYHPRVWRGFSGTNPFIDAYDVLQPSEVYGRVFISSLVAAESLFKEVNSVFRHIEPELANYSVFGHRLRELLILLCTEIEANFKSFCEANFPSSMPARPNTSHYHAASVPLLLDQYSVSLKDYPHCVFSPFINWEASCATRSISWYEDYNAVKHDRNKNYSKSTLENVLKAAAALHVLQVSQWGPKIFSSLSFDRYTIFKEETVPTIAMGDVYIPALNTENGFITAVPFEAASL